MKKPREFWIVKSGRISLFDNKFEAMKLVDFFTIHNIEVELIKVKEIQNAENRKTKAHILKRVSEVRKLRATKKVQAITRKRAQED